MDKYNLLNNWLLGRFVFIYDVVYFVSVAVDIKTLVNSNMTIECSTLGRTRRDISYSQQNSWQTPALSYIFARWKRGVDQAGVDVTVTAVLFTRMMPEESPVGFRCRMFSRYSNSLPRRRLPHPRKQFERLQTSLFTPPPKRLYFLYLSSNLSCGRK